MIAARRGFGLVEVIVAAAIILVLMSVCLELLTAMASQRRALDGRQTAIRQAANVIERVSARPWSELTDEHLRQMQQAEQSLLGAAGARLEIQLAQMPNEPDAKRITVLVEVEDSSGRPVRPVRLVAWRYRGIDH